MIQIKLKRVKILPTKFSMLCYINNALGEITLQQPLNILHTVQDNNVDGKNDARSAVTERKSNDTTTGEVIHRKEITVVSFAQASISLKLNSCPSDHLHAIDDSRHRN